MTSNSPEPKSYQTLDVSINVKRMIFKPKTKGLMAHIIDIFARVI